MPTTQHPATDPTDPMDDVASNELAMERLLWLIDEYHPRFEVHTVMTETMRQIDGVKEIKNFGYAICVEFKSKKKAEEALSDGKVVIATDTENRSFRFVTTDIAATYIASKRNVPNPV